VPCLFYPQYLPCCRSAAIGSFVPKPAILHRPKIFMGKARSNEIKLARLHSF